MTLRFDAVLRELIAWLKINLQALPPDGRVVAVRDIRGQVRLIVESADLGTWNSEKETEISQRLGAYRAAGDFLIQVGTENGFDDFFNAPEAFSSAELPERIKILDRLITGREWLYPVGGKSNHPPRFVFFGLKGGVGRSTALSMVAWHLAQQGKKVLVIDLDLESPGLGNMLLPVRQDLREDGDTALPGWPDYGMTDWFVEDAVGQANEALLNQMIQPSPIEGSGQGEIIVVPAAGGLYDQNYVSKLSRSYADLPNAQGKIEVFGDRLTRAISQIENHVQPDVVLLDSRAGIHHISATALTRLDARVYLFASDSEQTWAGFNALFSHWALKTETIRQIRGSLRLVSALTPFGSEKKTFRDAYGEHSFDTFVRLYDDGSNPASGDDLFSFGVFEDDAPHRPVLVWQDSAYLNFSPLTKTVQLDTEKAQLVFEELFTRIDRDLNNKESS